MILSLIIFIYGWKLFKVDVTFNTGWSHDDLFLIMIMKKLKKLIIKWKLILRITNEKINEHIDDKISEAFVGLDDEEEKEENFDRMYNHIKIYK